MATRTLMAGVRQHNRWQRREHKRRVKRFLAGWFPMRLTPQMRVAMEEARQRREWFERVTLAAQRWNATIFAEKLGRMEVVGDQYDCDLRVDRQWDLPV